MNILLVEDDQKAARLLARGLEEEGFKVAVVHSAEEADALMDARFDMVILDWMLPGRDGIALCDAWRCRGLRQPILMLTARDAVADRVAGLNTGADDYLTKPFDFDELLARVRALLRRTEAKSTHSVRVADVELDVHRHTATCANRDLNLTPKEYAILEILMRQADQVVSRLQLAEQVWQVDLIAIDNLIDVHIKNLRRKFDASGSAVLIETVRGRGFRLCVAGHA
ncbi:response regulator transcription factor [Massilia sp. Root335]|uniref:response regulator transcription factor n=1 Tax=Massilia sp. Root335 TaxID=1736517 RepID=UPI0006FB7550|nr:response regulator transcription factor [Massilia sp. Root335]KQV45107.1 PhoB family transcriptional regulator [Massilia sp. Root335]